MRELNRARDSQTKRSRGNRALLPYLILLIGLSFTVVVYYYFSKLTFEQDQSRFQKTVQELGLTQRQAAARLPISQSRLSLISRGKLDDISQEMLEKCLQALGHDIEIRVGPRHRGMGELRVLERV